MIYIELLMPFQMFADVRAVELLACWRPQLAAADGGGGQSSQPGDSEIVAGPEGDDDEFGGGLEKINKAVFLYKNQRIDEPCTICDTLDATHPHQTSHASNRQPPPLLLQQQQQQQQQQQPEVDIDAATTAA